MNVRFLMRAPKSRQTAFGQKQSLNRAWLASAFHRLQTFAGRRQVDGPALTSHAVSMNKTSMRLGRAWLGAHPLLDRAMAQVSRLERWTMIVIGIAAATLFAFAKLGEEMVEGDTRAFDEYVLLALRTPGNPSDPIGPGWFEEMMRDFTALGGTAVLLTVTLAVTGYLIIARRRRLALTVAVSVITGMLLSQTLKWGFARPRPDLVPALTQVYTHSFPSGHAMVSAVVYLTLGVLCARAPIGTAMKAYLLSVATLLTFIVGISRVYLGVHWPTDVLAGWAGGAAWALLCWLGTLWLQSRGMVETGW